MTRKFFTLEPGEEFIGVIRPSMWYYTPRILASLFLVILPFLFWSSLLASGFIFGAVIAIVSFIAGMVTLRDVRRYYLENGVYVTSLRLIDVFAGRRSCRIVELPWSSVVGVDILRRGLFGFFGYGSCTVRGNDDVGFSIVVSPIWRPHLVAQALPEVYSQHL